MTVETLERVCQPDLQVRSDGRTVFGIVMPYNVEARVDDGYGPYTEVFRLGAFAKSISERGDRIKLLVNHDKFDKLPVGVSQSFREDAVGLRGEFRVSTTSAGDEVLSLIRDGAVDSFSAGFVPVIPSLRDPIPRSGIVERTEAKLDHVGVVGFPAYEDARIAGVRSQFDFDAIWDELTSDEREAIRDLDLVTLIRQAAITSDEAAEGTFDEADDPEEPPTDVERSAGHSDATQQLRSVLDRHRDISEVARRLAKVTRN